MKAKNGISDLWKRGKWDLRPVDRYEAHGVSDILDAIAAAFPAEAVIEINTPLHKDLRSKLNERAQRRSWFNRNSFRFLNHHLTREIARTVRGVQDDAVCQDVIVFLNGTLGMQYSPIDNPGEALFANDLDASVRAEMIRRLGASRIPPGTP